MSGLWWGEAMAIVGKGIDAWRDAMCELRLESRKTTDTVRDPCWQRPDRYLIAPAFAWACWIEAERSYGAR